MYNPHIVTPVKSVNAVQITKDAIDLIKECEGLRLIAYRDSANVWTIGYGHTGGVFQGMVINEGTAEQMLMEDLSWVSDTLTTCGITLRQNEFNALAVLIYNIGETAFNKSTLKRVIKNKAGETQIRKQWLRWVFANGKRLDGLVKRRNRELELYFKREDI
jgi:lysozyme